MELGRKLSYTIFLYFVDVKGWKATGNKLGNYLRMSGFKWVEESSDLKDISNLPNAIEQEDKLDAKKNERERLGSVNLRADEETEQ